MNNEELPQLISYLIDQYDPVSSIILHGSRATGYATPHSDWDFIVLTEHTVDQQQFRDNVKNEEIEFEVFTLPISKDRVLDLFGNKLRHAKVVFDTKDYGKNLVSIAQQIYESGIPTDWTSPKSRASKQSYFQSAVNGMKDNIDNPAMFMKKFCSFYPRIITMWYQFKLGKFSDNLYLSLPFIKEKDPLFFNLIEEIYSFDSSPEKKVQAAQHAVDYIFEDTKSGI